MTFVRYLGGHNINELPSLSADGFRLDSLSRCVGGGVDSLEIHQIWYTAPASDYFGNPRPNPVDEYVDMGAIESSFMAIPSSENKLKLNRTDSFQLFPNPADDHVVLLADHYDHYSLELYTSSGQLVQQREFMGNSRTIDLSSFEKGMYVLLIRTQGKVWTSRLIKQ